MTGVAAGDVLAVRAAADVGAAVIGTLAADARAVEVVRPDPQGAWGLVNLGAESGWASLRFLARRPGQGAGDFPPVAACFGTEPFWTLSPRDDGVLWSTPGRTATGTTPDRLVSRSRPGRYGLLTAIDGVPLSAVLAARSCSDGMSDRAFGLAFDAVFGADVLSGCCTLAPSPSGDHPQGEVEAPRPAE